MAGSEKRAGPSAEFDPSEAFFPANLPDMDGNRTPVSVRAPAPSNTPASQGRPAAPAPTLAPVSAQRPQVPPYVVAGPAWYERTGAKAAAAVGVLVLAVIAYLGLFTGGPGGEAPATAKAPAASGVIQSPPQAAKPAPEAAPANPPPAAAPVSAQPATATAAPSGASAGAQARPGPTSPASEKAVTTAASPRPPGTRAPPPAAPQRPAPAPASAASAVVPSGGGVTHTKGGGSAASTAPADPPPASVPASPRPPAKSQDTKTCAPAVAALGLCTP